MPVWCVRVPYLPFVMPEHRLSRDFDYHRIPAPWIQLKLLRILAYLGTADQRASEVTSAGYGGGYVCRSRGRAVLHHLDRGLAILVCLDMRKRES